MKWRWGGLSLLWTSFGYFKYFRDLKVCINYFVCEEPFSCLFILLVFIRESLWKMQHFHLEKNINFLQNCSVSFQIELYICLCILLDRKHSTKCTHSCICVYILTEIIVNHLFSNIFLSKTLVQFCLDLTHFIGYILLLPDQFNLFIKHY